MTRVARNRILKDANGDISDHLRNHIHLTNCIHLKNHMHKQSPVLTDRAFMRDLIVLQRSRSLRDPSASPPTWHSPPVVDLLPRKGDRGPAVREGRRSVDGDRCREATISASKVVPGEGIEEKSPVEDGSSESGFKDGGRRVGREESSRKSYRATPRDQGLNNLVRQVISGSSEPIDQGGKKAEMHDEGVHIKTLSEQLNDIHMDSDDVASSNVRARRTKTGDVRESAIRGCSSSLNRTKRRKFRRARRARAAPPLARDVGKSEMSVASNSLTQGAVRSRHAIEEEQEECRDQNVTRAPKNGCGIPWNWSRIHDRGKSFLDMAGRSFSCGLSESRLKKGGSNGRDIPDMPVASDGSSSFSKSDSEALPLLVEASGFHGSPGHANWVHDYSGELGIYADHLLKNDIDSDLASEARSGEKHRFQGDHNARHQSLTQKYAPRTFRDLVGQNLVVQALSNAVVRRKVGFLYVFYGPHGTGKTSSARIFSRALACHSMEQPKPCGFCSSCISHEMGKSRNIREVGPISNFDFERIMDLLDNMIISQLPSHYRVFIFDDCDNLSSECWSAISKVIDRAPRRVVFILVCSSLEVLPHILISRCQKFFFPKLKDADIIYTLQWIASKEDIEIDKDALKLIASRSDGSLRDAEMTLEQLSLLGQKISVSLVQELVGLISDEKLVDLLDLALSADTVNTVKNLRVIMETGVEPLALMSQLATVITDILAGGYDFTKEKHRRKFFRRQPLSKEDMERLRQALKTLSEAEKQLRTSNDKLTWLTAALLQLAPDQQYLLPSSSVDTSFNHSPLPLNNVGGREMPRKSVEKPSNERRLSQSIRMENDHHHQHHHHRRRNSSDFIESGMVRSAGTERRKHAGHGAATQAVDMARVSGRLISSKAHPSIEEIWLAVIQNIQINSVKDFLYKEGKLVSVSFGAAPTVQLMLSSQLTKSTAEKFRGHILQAFESVLGSPVTIEIRCESTRDRAAGSNAPLSLPASGPGVISDDRPQDQNPTSYSGPREADRNEIVEIPTSPRRSAVPTMPGRRSLGELSQSRSLVRSKVSLAHVIQQVEGCKKRKGWSKRKAVSIAEKLEQENLRLEPRSRSLLCWKASRGTRRKLSRLRVRSRRTNSLMKLVSCGECLTSRSPG